jgi:Protein of unknown function (DUF3551)
MGHDADDDVLEKSREDHEMKKLTIAGLMLAASLGALEFGTLEEANAHGNYPWCIIGYHRSFDCAFSSRDQCFIAAANLGVARRCLPNPFYNPAAPSRR